MNKHFYNIIKNMRLTKMVAIIAPLTLGGLGSGLLTSCNDFLTIYPTDRIVGTDFWKTKADVNQMVDGAYSSMLSGNIQERAIMWGAFRSDELVKNTDFSSTALDNVSAVNLLPTMGYCSWGGFYSVINRCNIVLRHAPEVMQEDPEFTQGDYDVVRAQMLALRSLCYFYLVRAFRDVPYVTQSYEDDSQINEVAQSSAGEVLQNCLNDLEEASKYIMKSGGYGQNDWRNWGYMTRDAVYALMADIYLWRASMTHDRSDYQQVVTLADRIIQAKDDYYNAYHTNNVSAGDEEDIYHLYTGSLAQSQIFVTGNSSESILEWQYNGRNNSNETLENYYYHEKEDKTSSMVMASPIFNAVAINANTSQGKKAFYSTNDYRFWNVVYNANNEEAEQLPIRKMVDNSSMTISPLSTTGAPKTDTRNYKEFRQNWIVYRITDIMLMKAEALLELADESDRVAQKAAFDLVEVVNKRSMLTSASDLLKFDDFATKSALELLILAERERELCFEGKRWFDLVRYCYRHMNGVNIYQKMGDASNWPALYAPMTELLGRKSTENGQGSAIAIKMKTEPYLYWPVQESEMKVNSLLKQNPVWIQEKTSEKS
ncbi:MAG: RagB/SusD family nutrient uptake outer membrane protein [Prevotella sp.]|nr:RagB/SusD family nutrient uptake outer membrane protein [Prevotella sp.]